MHLLLFPLPSSLNYLNLSSFNCFSGFAKEQAETIVSALITLSNVSLETVYKDMVTQAQQVTFIYGVYVHSFV